MSATCLPAPASAPVVRRKIAPERRLGIDVARLAAAYSIIWLHTARCPELGASRVLGRFAVPFFIFAAVFFVFDGLQRDPQRAFVRYALSRVQRIYLPFVAWSVVYFLFKLVKGWLLPEQSNTFPGLSVFWEGTFYHLWFMPFILVVSLFSFALGKALRDRDDLAWTVCIVAGVAGAVTAAMPTPALLTAAGQYGRLVEHAIPSVCGAIALAVAWRHPASRWLEKPAASVLAGAAAIVCTAWIWRFGYGVKCAETLAGLAVMILALRPVHGHALDRLARLGPLAYGIYLSHLLVIKVLESLGTKLAIPVSWQLDVTVFLATVVLSTCLAWALYRWRPTRWLVA